MAEPNGGGELVLELPGLADPAWSTRLSQAFAADPALGGLTLQVVAPAAGGFGADAVPTARISGKGLDTAAKLAGIASLVVALYAAAGPAPPTATPQCHVTLGKGDAVSVATFDCKKGLDAEMRKLLEAHIAKHGPPVKIKVTPVKKQPVQKTTKNC
jgi:hypothetical protein